MWIVLRKELFELFRDKRTLILMILLPVVILPLLLAGLAEFTKSKAMEESNRILRYAVIGGEAAPEVLRHLQAMPQSARQTGPIGMDTALAIKQDKLDFALIIPPDFETSLVAGKPASLILEYNDAVSTDTIATRVRQIVIDYSSELRQRYLVQHNMDIVAQTYVREPVLLKVRSTANERERWGEVVGPMFAYLLLIFSMQAAMASAADLGAGEKERGTLESLLLLPLSREKIVVAKFLAITAVGCITGVLAVITLAVIFAVFVQGAAVGGVTQYIPNIQIVDFALVGMMTVPANAIVAAILLSISLYARSHKEATSYGTMVMLFLFVPILIALAPNMRLHNTIWAWVPFTNISLAVKEIIKGTLNASDLAVVIVSTALLAGCLLKLCALWCKREEVLFRF
jgi:sodium transport system permease protein